MKTRNRILTYAAMGTAVAALYHFVIRPKHLTWGTRGDESKTYLPGDELIPGGEGVTHAIDIDAPVEAVWPWLAQVGQDKAGFYSYTWLENLFGCEMKNSMEIHPEWQNVKEGDSIKFHPNLPSIPIAMLRANQHLVMHANAGKNDETTWGFYLIDHGDKQSRLLLRLRARSKSLLQRFLAEFTVEPAHFIMERKMMLTLKALAERKQCDSRMALSA